MAAAMLSTALPVMMKASKPSARSAKMSVARQTVRAPVRSASLSSRVSVSHIARVVRPVTALRSRSLVVRAAEDDEIPTLDWDPSDPSAFTLGILGDLHVDPRDLEHTFEGREHMKAILKDAPNAFLVSLGDLGESKDCTQTQQLYAGTSECFTLVREYLDGFGVPFNIVGGNHDLEGIDEFQTDEENLEAYLRILGKETPQFAHVVAPKTLIVGIGSTVFRDAPYTSHEVYVDEEQLKWFEETIKAHPAEDGWSIFCFSHAPIIGSALRVLQECHVVNGCCWLNHNDKVSSKKFIEIVRSNSSIKGWFSGHFHLSHDYEDSITFPGGNSRGSCVFAQTGVMTARSTRDGRRHSRLVRGNKDGFEVCTVDHGKGGVMRLDATVFYQDACIVDEEMLEQEGVSSCSVVHFAHPHEDYDHDQWFSAYVPEEDDGCYVQVSDMRSEQNPSGILNPEGSDVDFASRDAVCWWHMKDGAVLGGHNGMIIEYDPSTLAPLGMVVSRDELLNRRVAVIDDGWGTDALVLYDDETNDITVVQPNEDGSYWRKVVRNKMHRTREMRKMKAAKAWLAEQRGADSEVNVLSSYGPYKNTAGQVMGLTTKAINPKAKANA
eukprot:CAMPEP_0118921598 /NCGR_PEP_ID=MMETSP1169-20130426/819_1 /TAXON_ID=36882 /ORGANISM="Pyramimonas obovata, Strain CCMP722" /LENGTH=607 /DNA_ID=CAMNT_0006862347 /DNA_START=55 /DNA_END=1878 /DNA_ORIENTATION=-